MINKIMIELSSHKCKCGETISVGFLPYNASIKEVERVLTDKISEHQNNCAMFYSPSRAIFDLNDIKRKVEFRTYALKLEDIKTFKGDFSS